MIKILTAADGVLRGTNLRDEPSVVIGLVNNMPDAALQATERQFCDLLAEVSRDLMVYMRLFSIPQLPRSEAAREFVNQRYEDASELLAAEHLDGLIVTGAEPRATVLSDEPYWPALTKIVDWAEGHATSSIWSCLAAHAAVLHLDGIQRQLFRKKLTGVFECEKVVNDDIVSGSASRWCVPHSRYNDLPEPELVAKDYRIVSRAPEVGADMFVRRGRTLSIYLQGHPEYDRDALFREYRRDIRAFVAGERDRYPDMPRGYFDDETAAEFDALRQQAQRNGGTGIVLNFPETKRKLAHDWHEQAMRLYTNWLSYLVEHRHPDARSRKPHSNNASQAA
jgi:homoserine O-succinyltransferase